MNIPVTVRVDPIIEKWRARYHLVQEAFQQKHVNVTRLEIRADETEAAMESQRKRAERDEKRISELASKLEVVERELKAVKRRLPKPEKKDAEAQDDAEAA